MGTIVEFKARKRRFGPSRAQGRQRTEFEEWVLDRPFTDETLAREICIRLDRPELQDALKEMFERGLSALESIELPEHYLQAAEGISSPRKRFQAAIYWFRRDANHGGRMDVRRRVDSFIKEFWTPVHMELVVRFLRGGISTDTRADRDMVLDYVGTLLICELHARNAREPTLSRPKLVAVGGTTR